MEESAVSEIITDRQKTRTTFCNRIFNRNFQQLNELTKQNSLKVHKVLKLIIVKRYNKTLGPNVTNSQCPLPPCPHLKIKCLTFDPMASGIFNHLTISNNGHTIQQKIAFSSVYSNNFYIEAILNYVCLSYLRPSIFFYGRIV